MTQYLILIYAYPSPSYIGNSQGRLPALTAPQGSGGVGSSNRRSSSVSSGTRAMVAKHAPVTAFFVDDQSFHNFFGRNGVQASKAAYSRPREVVGAVGVGSLFGALSGFAAKRFGQALAFGAGLVMVSMKVGR